MAHLHKKVKKDHTYYYIRESQRIKGRPTIVNQVYLGTADKVQSLLESPEGSPPEGFSPKEYGSVFLINELDQDIDLAGMIDELLPPGKKIRGPSLGEIIFYAALNRAIAPTSKRKLAAWYEQTDIQRIRPVRLISLSSQNFWNHWDRVRTPELEKIKSRFFKKVISLIPAADNAHLLLEAGLLFPGASQNSGNYRSAAGYARFNKASRRQVKVALLTNRSGIPIYYQAYDDDEPVAKYFDQIVDNLQAKVSALGGTYQDLTILLGIGINSLPIREKIASKPGLHFVAALPPDALPKLQMVPLSRYQVLSCQHNRRLQAANEAHQSILYHDPVSSGPEKSFILFDPALFKKMRRELREKIQKLRQDLIIWQRELRHQAIGFFSGEIQDRFALRCKDLLLEPEVLALTFGRENGKSFVQARLNRRYCESLLRKMGKTIIQTDRLDWTPEDICDLAVDRGLLGDSPNRPRTLFQSALTPQYHWTDSKIPIHVFVCLVALTYLCFLNNRIRKAGLLLDAKETIEEMRSLKTAIFLLSEDAKPQRLFEEPGELHARIVQALGYVLDEGKIVPQEK